MVEIFRFFHVFSNYLWMGSFLILSAYLGLRKQDVSLQEMSTLNKVYYRYQLPALISSLVFGGLLIYLSPTVNFKAGWFHLKLTCVALLICIDLFWVRRKISTCHLIQFKGSQLLLPRLLGSALFMTILVAIYILKPLMAA